MTTPLLVVRFWLLFGGLILVAVYVRLACLKMLKRHRMECSHAKISEKTLCKKSSEKSIFLWNFRVEKSRLEGTIPGGIDG